MTTNEQKTNDKLMNYSNEANSFRHWTSEKMCPEERTGILKIPMHFVIIVFRNTCVWYL